MNELKELYNTIDELYRKHHLKKKFSPYMKPKIELTSNSLEIKVEPKINSDFILDLDEMFGSKIYIFPLKEEYYEFIRIVYYFNNEEDNDENRERNNTVS